MWKRETPAIEATSSRVSAVARWLSIYHSAFCAGFIGDGFRSKHRDYARLRLAWLDRGCGCATALSGMTPMARALLLWAVLGRLHGLLAGFLLGRLQFLHGLLQPAERAFQNLDLAIGGVDLLPVFDPKPGDRLLQEVHIALQATGAPLHCL